MSLAKKIQLCCNFIWHLKSGVTFEVVSCWSILTFSTLSLTDLFLPRVTFYFRENRTKFDPKWEDDDTVLSYSLAINYTFDDELSTAGDPTQIKITTINVPLLVGI